MIEQKKFSDFTDYEVLNDIQSTLQLARQLDGEPMRDLLADILVHIAHGESTSYKGIQQYLNENVAIVG
jgi:hypothetical protein